MVNPTTSMFPSSADPRNLSQYSCPLQSLNKSAFAFISAPGLNAFISEDTNPNSLVTVCSFCFCVSVFKKTALNFVDLFCCFPGLYFIYFCSDLCYFLVYVHFGLNFFFFFYFSGVKLGWLRLFFFFFSSIFY